MNTLQQRLRSTITNRRLRSLSIPRLPVSRTTAIVVAGMFALLVLLALVAASLGEAIGEGGLGFIGPAFVIGMIALVIGLAAASSGLAVARAARAHRIAGGTANARYRTSRAASFEVEQRILALAKETGGPITAPEVALHCRLGLLQSREALERMVALDFAHGQLTDEGDVAYWISGFRPTSNTANA